ncbi:DUF3068 domain-containing protein [Nocardioides salsibiostraticola]
MRKNLGFVVLGLSGFLLLVGLMSVVWAPSKAERTPLDTDSTNYLVGEGGKLDTSTGSIEIQPVQLASFTKADAKASDDDVIVWVTSSCLVIQVDDPADCVDGEDPRLITATESVFATDRFDGLAVNGEKYLPEGTPTYEGLVNKWPFGSEKKTYPYWDGTIGEVVDAVYDRTEKLGSLETYVYKVNVVDAPIEIAAGVPGTYNNDLEIFVEPETGAIVDQYVTQTRFLEDGTQALDLQLQFSEESLNDGIKTIEDNLSTLNLLTKSAPLIGFIGGFLLLALGLFLVMAGGSTGSRSAGASPKN